MYLGSRDMCRLRELEQHLMELDLDLNRTEHTSWQEYLRGKKVQQEKSAKLGRMSSLCQLLFLKWLR